MNGTLLGALIINYLKAGAIAWIVWVIMAAIYTAWALRDGVFRLHVEPGEKNRKWTLMDVLILIMWPWGLFYSINKLVEIIHEMKTEKE